MKLHCETCGKDVPEVLFPTCAKWWHDNPPELEARATAAEAREKKLREALTRQADNMAFVLNHFDVFGQWYFKFRTELEEDRAALQENQNAG
ncbi:MAG: hypothetical protein WCL10_18825 [Novosphingobium sp.]|uniref:hypothetical protein n=1 Tax=Novosphingobium sp. TaxID=1874826 RepID=UPI00301AD966